MRKARFWVRTFLPAVLVIASLALALAAATARANSPAATISFTGGGSLVSNPGPVTVTVKYNCLPPSPGFITVDMDENGTAFGGTFLANAICDDKSHSVTVTVDGLFFPGVAAGRAILTNNSGGATAMANDEIKIQ